MSRLLSIILVALVFACPLWCAFSAGSCCDTVVQASPSCCCSAPATPPGDDQPAQPQPVQPEKRSQCICGGAILIDGPELNGHDVWTLYFDSLTLQLNEWTSISEWSVAMSPNSKVKFRNSGREIRHLFMSLTI